MRKAPHHSENEAARECVQHGDARRHELAAWHPPAIYLVQSVQLIRQTLAHRERRQLWLLAAATRWLRQEHIHQAKRSGAGSSGELSVPCYIPGQRSHPSGRGAGYMRASVMVFMDAKRNSQAAPAIPVGHTPCARTKRRKSRLHISRSHSLGPGNRIVMPMRGAHPARLSAAPLLGSSPSSRHNGASRSARSGRNWANGCRVGAGKPAQHASSAIWLYIAACEPRWLFHPKRNFDSLTQRRFPMSRHGPLFGLSAARNR